MTAAAEDRGGKIYPLIKIVSSESIVTLPESKIAAVFKETVASSKNRIVGNRFDPTIRFFNHATVSLNTAAILLSGKVTMPSLDTILISG